MKHVNAMISPKVQKEEELLVPGRTRKHPHEIRSLYRLEGMMKGFGVGAKAGEGIHQVGKS